MTFKKIDNGHFAIYNSLYCLKIYDTLGHGFGVTLNLAKEYNTELYDKDEYSRDWVFKYLGLPQLASFSSRKQKQYLDNIPLLIEDVKVLVLRMKNIDDSFWKKSNTWIENQMLNSG